MESMKRRWSASSKTTKVIVIIAAIGLVGGACNAISGDKTKSSMRDGFNAGRQAAGTSAPQNIAQRVFTAQYVGYDEKDGKVVVSFEAFKMTKDSVEGDVKRFMRQLTSERKDGWARVTMNAYGTSTDAASGKQSKKIVATYSFSREQAMAVVDWDRVDVVKAGLREFAVPQLLD